MWLNRIKELKEMERFIVDMRLMAELFEERWAKQAKMILIKRSSV